MATFSHFKDWIDDTVFVFRDEDEHEHIISEVKVKIFKENSDPMKHEWPGSTPKYPDCHQLYTNSTFKNNLFLVQWPQLAYNPIPTTWIGKFLLSCTCVMCVMVFIFFCSLIMFLTLQFVLEKLP